MVTALELEVQAFFDQYNEAFASIDGNRIASLYHAPPSPCEATDRFTASVLMKSLHGSSKKRPTLTNAMAMEVRPFTTSRSLPVDSAAPWRP